MARKANSIPSYLRHSSGCARVGVDGRQSCSNSHNMHCYASKSLCQAYLIRFFPAESRFFNPC